MKVVVHPPSHSHHQHMNSSADRRGGGKRSSRRLPRLPQRHLTVLLTFLCTCVCYMERVGFSIAYTAWASAAGVGQARKGAVLSTFYHGYASSQVAGGWAAQRLGGRRVLLASFLVWSVTSALTPTGTGSDWALMAARLLVGAAQGFIFPSIHAVLAQWVPAHERSRSVSLTTSGMYLGAAVGMWVLPGLVALHGPRTVFVAVAGLGALWAAAWWRMAADPAPPQLGLLPITTSDDVPEGVPLLLRDRDAKKKTAAAAAAAGGLAPPPPPPPLAERRRGGGTTASIPWKKILASPAVWAIVANNFTFHYALYVLMNWLPTYFNQALRVGLHTMGGFSKTLPYLLMFLFSNAGGVVADALIARRACSLATTRKLLNTAGFAVAAAALLAMPRLQSAPAAVACSSVALGFCALARAGFAVNHMDIAPRFAGILMGISNTAGTLAGSIGVAASGRILEASSLGPQDRSSWNMVFATPALLCMASAAVFCVFASGEKLFD